MFKKDIHLETLYLELPFEDRFAAAKADGFDLVEIWGWEDKDLPRIRTLLDQNGLTLAAMSGDGPYSMSDPADQTGYLDYIRSALKAAAVVDCRTLVIHSDALQKWPKYAKPLSGDYSDVKRWCTMFDILKTVAPWAEDAGVTLVLEALNTVKEHCGNFLRYTSDAADLVSSVGSPNIRLLYDAYHMYLNEGKLCETTEKYLPWIGHIHIADAPGRHEPGTGVIQYRRFLEHLDRLGYRNTVGFELFAATDTAAAVRAIQDCTTGIS